MSFDCPSCDSSYDTRRALTSHHHQMHPEEVEERFWIWIEVGDDDECWEYQGATLPDGHGLMTMQKEIDYVHRWSYRMHFEDPGEMQVNHHCDTAHCVNPEHLYLGTQSDNIKDMWRRRRRHPDEMRGENAPHSKLTWEDVQDIRERLDSGAETYEQIADDYPVTPSSIASVATGEIWNYDRKPTRVGTVKKESSK